MVQMLDNPINVTPKEYAHNSKNAGKVALFNMNDNIVIAEGDESSDWLKIEKLRQERESVGDYKIVIVPSAEPRIVSLSY